MMYVQSAVQEYKILTQRMAIVRLCVRFSQFLQATAASFHILSKALFTQHSLFNLVYFEVLTPLLNKPQINKLNK
jgi:hypothetical protein